VPAAIGDAAPSAPEIWTRVFGNHRPVEVEIGCGTGAFLVAAARRFPARNFLGLERAPRLAAVTGRAIAAARVENAQVLCCDARCVVAQLLPPRAVAAYHLYFPDPWWKRRHHRRRLCTPALVEGLARTLIPGGRVHLATDVPALFGEIVDRLARAGFRPAGSPDPAPPTVFARRCLAAGRPVQQAVFALRGLDPQCSVDAVDDAGAP
jgi:tRNA (guanine-N7-)-methyltransferase